MSIALISLSTALNVFTLNVHHKGLRGHKVPYCLKRVFFGIIAKMLFLKIDLPVAPEEGMVCYCYNLKKDSVKKERIWIFLKFKKLQ